MAPTENETAAFLPNDPANGMGDLTNAVPNPPAWLVEAMSVPRTQGTLNVNDCPINYFSWGDPTRPGILMMHGFLAHSRCFAFIAPFLAADYHVVAFDLSGMGDSGSRHMYPMDVRAAEAIEVANQTGLFNLGTHGKKPTLIAHSYGGHVGLEVMQAAADKFDGLIICDLMTLRPVRLEAHFKTGKRPGSQDPDRPNRIYPDYETAKGRFVLSPPQPAGVPALYDYMAYHSLRQVEGGWTWKFSPSVFRRETDMDDHLERMGHSTVEAPGRKAILYGEQSMLFDRDSADYIREIGGTDIPMIGIPNARHHLMLDQPLAFVSALRSVLALWA